MQEWLIALIVLSSIVALALIALLTAFLTYRIAFYSNRKKGNEAYLKKVMESYGEYGEFFEKLVKNVEEGEFTRVSIKSFDGLTLSARYFH